MTENSGLLLALSVCLILLLQVEGDIRPVGFYPLDSTHGFNDTSGCKNPAGSSSQTTLVPGYLDEPGGASRFAGVASSFARLPNNGNFNSSSITLLAWIYPETLGNSTVIQFSSEGRLAVFLGLQQDGNLYIELFSRYDNQSLGRVYDLGLQTFSWYFIGAAYDHVTGNVTLWVRDREDTWWWRDSSFLGYVQLETYHDVWLGYGPESPGAFLGRLACVQIHNVALTQEQMKEAGKRCLPKAWSEPLALYPLNSEHKAHDISGNNIDGTPSSWVDFTKEGPYFGEESASFTGQPLSHLFFFNDRLVMDESFTILTWIYVQENGGNIVAFYLSFLPFTGLILDSSNVLTASIHLTNTGLTETIVGSQLTLRTWHHVALVYNHRTGNASVYINGVAIASRLLGNGEVYTSGHVHTGYLLNGRIACLQFYRRPLLVEHVQDARDRCYRREPGPLQCPLEDGVFTSSSLPTPSRSGTSIITSHTNASLLSPTRHTHVPSISLTAGTNATEGRANASPSYTMKSIASSVPLQPTSSLPNTSVSLRMVVTYSSPLLESPQNTQSSASSATVSLPYESVSLKTAGNYNTAHSGVSSVTLSLAHTSVSLRSAVSYNTVLLESPRNTSSSEPPSKTVSSTSTFVSLKMAATHNNTVLFGSTTNTQPDLLSATVSLPQRSVSLRSSATYNTPFVGSPASMQSRVPSATVSLPHKSVSLNTAGNYNTPLLGSPTNIQSSVSSTTGRLAHTSVILKTVEKYNTSHLGSPTNIQSSVHSATVSLPHKSVNLKTVSTYNTPLLGSQRNSQSSVPSMTVSLPHKSVSLKTDATYNTESLTNAQSGVFSMTISLPHKSVNLMTVSTYNTLLLGSPRNTQSSVRLASSEESNTSHSLMTELRSITVASSSSNTVKTSSVSGIEAPANWTQWSTWSVCSKACATGTQTRRRECNTTRSTGCTSGEPQETQECNTHLCDAIVVNLTVVVVEWPWNGSLLIEGSPTFVVLESQLQENVNHLFLGDSSLVGVRLISCRKGSVIALFSVTFGAVDSTQILKLTENIEDGFISSLPVVLINITADKVPNQRPTISKSYLTSATSFQVFWTQVDEPIDGYQVLYRPHPTGVWSSATVASQTTSMHLQNLLEGAWYSVSVLAFNQAGNGIPSETIEMKMDEGVPKMAPIVTVSTKKTTTSLFISWTAIPEEHASGELLGYHVMYKPIKIADQEVHVTEPTMVTVPAQGRLELNLTSLTSFTMYEFIIQGYTEKGDGQTSATMFGETCRCPKFLYTNWAVLPPYVAEVNQKPGGIIGELLEDMILSSCGTCQGGHGPTILNYEENGRQGPSKKTSTAEVVSDVHEKTQISFPIVGNMDDEKYLKDFVFVPVVESPGVAFITLTNDVEKMDILQFALLKSVTVVWLTLAIGIIVAVLIWIAEMQQESAQFSRSFMRGTGELTWFSLMSITTVGYGEKVPMGVISRLLAGIWILLGLVLIPAFIATLTVTLTVITMSTQTTLYGAKVTAIKGSPAHRLGILRNAQVDAKESLNEAHEALINGETKALLLDAYIAGSQLRLEPQISHRVNKVIKTSKGFGVVLSGEATNLRYRARDFVKNNARRITEIIGNSTSPLKQPDESETEEKATHLMGPASPVLRQTIAVAAVILGVTVMFGITYEVFRNRRKKADQEERDALLKLYKKTEMEALVQEFYVNISQAYKRLRSKHERQYNSYQVLLLNKRPVEENDISTTRL